MDSVSFVPIVVSLFGAYIAWRLLRNFIVRSPLDNIPGPPSRSIFTGNLMQLFAHDSWDFTKDLIDTYGPVSKTKMLHVYDPKALHAIVVKDQDVYVRDDEGLRAVELLLGPGLLSTAGATHKRQRKTLNPVFAAAHMRAITPLFYDVTSNLRQAIEARIREGAEAIDMIHWMGRTALELIGQGALGHSFDSLIEDSNDEYTEAVKAFIPSTIELEHMRVVLPFVDYMGPKWFRRKLLNIVPYKKLQRMKNIVDIMYERSTEIYRAKKAAIERGDETAVHQVGEGKDVMSILLNANKMASEGDKLTDEEILAQMSTFILAGVDTTSNAMARILHLLSLHPEVQGKLRKEIIDAREQYGNDIPYDELSQLPYLDAVCRETLRLHTPVNLSVRCATRDIVLPLWEPIRGVDGKIMNEVLVPAGTMTLINLGACNTNKVLWGEDALEWKPERWLSPLPRAVDDAPIPGIYSKLMTFLGGGRSCIGFKFSQIEMKVVISVLVATFRFELSDRPFVWNFAGVTYPAKDKHSSKPEMYLRVTLVSE
ncbi:cytochrome P450 [Earliella scabrosa]|nr:cytochrome P450 [Earliella scabrosa]